MNGTQYVDLDQRIEIWCNATGMEQAPEDVDWFHEGHLIDTQAPKWQNRVSVETYKPKVPGHSLLSKLIIDRSVASDHGNYICRSSDLTTTSLKVHVLNGRWIGILC